jgi:hypothetical protein
LYSLKEASKLFGIPAKVIMCQLQRGWNVERAISEPKRDW